MNEFKPGDVVQLKSGGPKLTLGWKPEDTKGGDLVLTKQLSTEEPIGVGQTLTFSGGTGWAPDGKIPLHGRMRFVTPPGEEILRIEGDGRVFVRGELERTNKGIVDTFAEWLASTVIYSPVVGQTQQLLSAADEFTAKVKAAEDPQELFDYAIEFAELVRKECGGTP